MRHFPAILDLVLKFSKTLSWSQTSFRRLVSGEISR